MTEYTLTDDILIELETDRALFVTQPASISTVQNFHKPVFVRFGGGVDAFRLYTDTYGVAQLAARLGASALILDNGPDSVSKFNAGDADAFRAALDEFGGANVPVYVEG